MQMFCVGHVHFMLFMSISFVSGTQRKPVFQWNMGLSTFIFLNVSEILMTHGSSCSLGLYMDFNAKINIYL